MPQQLQPPSSTLRFEMTDERPLEVVWPDGTKLRLRWTKSDGSVSCESAEQRTIEIISSNCIVFKAK